VNLDFNKSLIVAICNDEEGKTAEVIADTLNKSKSSIQSSLNEMREKGYVVVNTTSDNNGDAQRYRCKPIAYNQADDVLTNYFKLTRLGLMLMEDGFNGYSARESA